MSDLIHNAQRAAAIVRDESLPRSERLRLGLQEMTAAAPEAAADFGPVMEAYLNENDETTKQLDRIIRQYGDDPDENARELISESQQKLSAIEDHYQRLLDMIAERASEFVDSALDQIMAEFSAGMHRLPEAAIRVAREHRDLVVPRLIQALENAIAGAREGNTPEDNAPFFALFLLAEFKATEAFPVILQALTLPDRLAKELFGEAIHELPARIFALFLGDRPEAIAALIDDPSLDYSPRWEAARSYLYLVRDGRMNRAEAVRRLQRHLRQAIDRDDAKVVTPLVCELVNYAPAEALAELQEAYQRGLAETFFIGFEDVEKSVAEGESRLTQELGRCRSLDVDTLAELRQWDSFRQKPETVTAAPPLRPAAARSPLFAMGGKQARSSREPIASRGTRVGRNDPCPCGSGKKFKKCCGARG